RCSASHCVVTSTSGCAYPFLTTDSSAVVVCVAAMGVSWRGRSSGVNARESPAVSRGAGSLHRASAYGKPSDAPRRGSISAVRFAAAVSDDGEGAQLLQRRRRDASGPHRGQMRGPDLHDRVYLVDDLRRLLEVDGDHLRDDDVSISKGEANGMPAMM